MTRNIFILLFCLFSFTGHTQQLSGNISDLEGKPIPFANIFIKELATGTTSNIDGQYHLDLPEGEWQLHYRYMGYKTKEVKVTMGQNNMELDVALAPQTYQLKEVKILASGEDPAYFVMRKAIAMGDYYTKQVSEYTNKVYLKGTGKITSVPSLLKNKLAKEEFTVGKVFVTENISKIHFQLPNKIEEEVISIRSSGLDDQVNPMQFITLNLYNTRDEGFISPLDKAAFTVYKFQFVSVFEDQGRIINQIKVTPKRKGKDLFNGFINITETFWNIHSADLKLRLPMTHIHMHQIYAPVSKDVWMPVSLDYEIKFKGMGFGLEGMYVASIKDYQVTLNPDLDHDYLKQEELARKQETEDINKLSNTEESKVLSAKEIERKAEIQTLLEKPDMKNSDMRKLARLMEKENSKNKKEKIKEPLEIKIEKVKMAKDAKTKDSIYWDEMRPIPLSKDEKISFVEKDSIVKVKNTPEYKDSVRRANREFKFNHLLWGKTYRYKESNSRLSTPGLLAFDKISYNTVQGFTFDAPFSYTKKDTIGHYFEMTSNLSYAFSREHLDYTIGSLYRYNGLKRAWLGFEAGSKAVDFNETTGINPMLNVVTSLYYKDNHMKLYDKNYMKVWHKIDLTNGLNLGTKLEYANRKQLYNNNKFYISGPGDNKYTPNIPKGINPELVRDNKALTFTAQLDYTPHHRYMVKKGVKQMTSYHSQPTFSLLYKQGIKDIFGSETDFSFLEASVKQEFEIGFNDRLAYSLKAGSFLSDKKTYFSDYRQFGTSKPVFMIGGDMNTFRLLDYYQHATNKEFAEAHIQYTSDRFLLKRLPILNNSLVIQEKVFVNYLTHEGKKNYWEAGYGLSQIFLLLDLEVFWSFDGKQHKETGLKIKFNI
ncbi:carboxypeptidase-like regulatory domain-containing protein [Ancylomarina euxinus]|uniref:Carboxypeptidase-like regulatory domain-containing protein n=1 Tax=Ancylomarina euxinus TaxID=2283627 RepID=A0A425Y4M3_9BACT|nr:DUF5686 and carboxypeptidase regulatory-like domain-containing protein [Ancylomarina euxinus]MCZ4694699.1 DUF5686 and carboxypeptidase regulatory-like domain-containing protein [Ancylomarina euxinus]MUP14243.1 hypothetical protein [Ancylomarina euxinus]RRG23091.1 carboxypeptidase-like regulatory domain-containing protein [Ancylomarina euxinus]